MKKQILLIIFILVSSVAILSSQPKMIISEYYNVSGAPVGEWFELLVIEDNANVVGYYVRDNSDTDDGVWQGGIVFKDVPLWRNLRKGTVIVVNNRGFSAADTDPSDGHLYIDAYNTEYFQIRVEFGVLPGENILNFNQVRECLQLLDASNNHVHALGQSTKPFATEVAAVPAPRVIHESSTVSHAVRFWGFGGGAYNQPEGTDSTANQINGDTKGFANQGATPAQRDINQLFWRAIRQPNWNNPTINPPNNVIGGVRISWNKATDPRPSDSTQGYLVTRHLKSQSASAQLPIDSYMYSIGANLGSAQVVAVINSSDSTEFIDKSFECDSIYIYRVFAFRYRNTGNDTDNNPLKGRGRSYNETQFAEREIRVAGIAPPQLSILEGTSAACVDDIIKIIARNVSSELDITYEWQINGAVHSQDKHDTLTVAVRRGVYNYRLKLTNSTGCVTYSNIIQIEGVDKPTAYIARIRNNVETKYLKNETVKLCKGDTLRLNGTGSSLNPQIRVNWFKDNVLWRTNQNVVNITENGVYHFIVTNQGACPDTSFSITAIFDEYNYALSESSLDFVVVMPETFIDKTIQVTNNATTSLVITQEMIVLPFGYSLIEPTNLPVTIPAGNSMPFVIRFQPADFGVFSGRFIILSPCGSKFTNLKGYKDSGVPMISAGVSTIDFGTIINCETNKIDTLITITALGNEEILMLSPQQASNGFSFNLNNFTPSIEPMKSFEIEITFFARDVGLYQDQILIPFKGKSKTGDYDTLRLNIIGRVVQPNLDFANTIIDFGVIQGCEATKDTSLVAFNNTPVPIIINQQPNDNRIVFKNLPINIQPNQSAEILIEYKATETFEDFAFEFAFEPCGIIEQLRIISEFKGMLFSLSEEEINFGRLFNCDPNLNFTETIDLFVYNRTEQARIESIFLSNNNNISVSGISIGSELEDRQELSITLINNGEGIIQEEVIITFAPCGNTIRLPITAEIIEFEYLISAYELDFGIVEVGETPLRSVTISNPMPDDLIISSINNIVPFELSEPIAFPIVISRNSSKELTFVYKPIENNANNQVQLNLLISSPCAAEIIVDLSGRTTSSVERINARLELPAIKITSEPGKRVFMPIRLLSKSSIALSSSQIENLSFTLNYNPTLLKPNFIVAAGSFLNNLHSITINELKAGEATVKFEPRDMSIFLDGDIAVIEFLALMGNAINTQIWVSDIRITSPQMIEIEPTTAEFEITGGCNLSQRLLQVGEKPSIINLGSNPISSHSEFVINHIIDGHLKVSVYNSLGECVKVLLDETKQNGQYKIQFNAQSLTNGVYFIVMQYEGGTEIESVLISR